MSKRKDDESQNTSPSDDSVSLTMKDAGREANELGTVFVDRNFNIKHFVTSIHELMRMDAFKIDYEFEDFARQFRYDGIKDDINFVLENKKKIIKEVTAEGGNDFYRMEIRPYLTDKGVEGVMINFVDITDLKKTNEELIDKVEKIRNLQRQIMRNDVSERWRIGQYLHDDLGQSLAAVKMMLENLRTSLPNAEKEVKDDFDKVMEIVTQSLEDVQSLSHGIVPIEIEEKGISDAFKNFSEQMEKNYAIHCELEYDDTLDKLTNIEIATHLYRIIHESAKNAATHGDADNVKVTLQSDDENLYLQISDDGTGLSEDNIDESGVGINIMYHRMELMGGTFEIKENSEKTGLTISCTLPKQEL